eukprot:TRINITY_DN33989_c0_g1_i1.p1 TRINITY_DN33989_c0_g1~~TRINITY_DN33989_c0_g1_i1.p1  ORF type:complete len:323 (+),score=68.46 TRINITY_DN33989_c0_g1_i1:50-970(+)
MARHWPSREWRAAITVVAALLCSTVRCAAAAGACAVGERVKAFFAAGEVTVEAEASAYYDYDYYYGGTTTKPCEPSMPDCYFAARIATSVDADGYYIVDWHDGDARARRMRAEHVKRASSDEVCGTSGAAAPEAPSRPAASANAAGGQSAPGAAAAPQAARAAAPPVVSASAGPATTGGGAGGEESDWVPPEIPCTILPRLHWEGSDPDWNKKAVEHLRTQFAPDELIDGFDWHVILRFNDADRCERVYAELEGILNKCTESNVDLCRTHDYVKAIEYVGDTPETRRKTGRRVHQEASRAAARSEL